MQKLRSKQGITLIALVITIIVLLILAAISIMMLTGENSILNRAAEAKEKTEMAQIKEEAEMVRNEYFMNKFLNNSSNQNSDNDNKMVQRYAISTLINSHFEGSAKSGNRITTKDRKYDIIVRNNLEIVVVKHGERYLKVGELEITYYVPEEDKAKKTIELYFELGDVPNKNAPTVEEPVMGDIPQPTITYEDYIQNIVSKKYESKSREELEELIVQMIGYEGTFDDYLTANSMTREQMAEMIQQEFNMEYDEYLKFSLIQQLNPMLTQIDYYVYLAGAEEKTGEELEQFYVDYIGYNGTFEQKLSEMGITTEEQLNEAIQQIGLTSKEDYVKYLIAISYIQQMQQAQNEVIQKYNQDRAEYEQLLAEYQQQFGDIELVCPDGSVKLISQTEMYTEYEVKQNGTYTFTATGPNGEEGTVTIEINDIAQITPEEVTIKEEETTTLSLTQSIGGLTWTSSKPSVATVENGVVKGIKTGTSIITAKTSDGTSISNSCTVTVNVPSITIEPSNLTIVVGKTATLTASETVKDMIWTSSNPSVATVEDGVVTGVKAGTAKITIKTKAGTTIQSYSEVTVKTMQEINRPGINVGDYIDYEPTDGTYSASKLVPTYTGNNNSNYYKNDITTKETSDGTTTKTVANWRVLRIYDDGSMDIIGDPTSYEMVFGYARGYNNGPRIMNDVCAALYSNSTHNITARSVNMDDFEVEGRGSWKSAKATYISNKISDLKTRYYNDNDLYMQGVDTTNNTVTYTARSSYYPNIYASERGAGINTTTVNSTENKEILRNNLDISNDRQYTQASTNGLTAEQTYYEININSTNFGEVAEVLNVSPKYFLASRWVNTSNIDAVFHLCGVTGGKLRSDNVLYSSQNYR